MTTAALPHDLLSDVPVSHFVAPDPDFDRRWNEWKVRGRVHERAVRRRVGFALAGASPFVLGALVVYILFSL